MHAWLLIKPLKPLSKEKLAGGAEILSQLFASLEPYQAALGSNTRIALSESRFMIPSLFALFILSYYFLCS
jgi:hypothetical protein